MAEAAPIVFNPVSYEFHSDPHLLYRRLREEAPVYRNDELGFWALSRFDDVHEAFRDWSTFSSARGIALETMGMGGSSTGNLLEMDPPDHTRLRKIVSRAFTARTLARITDEVRDIVTGYVSRMAASGEADLIAELAGPFPMDVICAILGIDDRADRDRLRELSDHLVAREDGSLRIPPAGLSAWAAMIEYFAEDVPRRRAMSDGRLISDLCQVELDGERLTDDEIIGFCFIFIVAGHETTTKMLGNAIDLLSAHPGQRDAVTADPSLIPGAIEEVMRFHNSTQYMARVTTTDVTLHGVTIPAGDPVLLLIGAANRDPREFDDPDHFDVTRRIERSLAFGHGAHYCLGANLARLEGRVALETIHRWIPDYELVRDLAERVHAGNVMGWSRAPIRFTARTAAEVVGQ